MSNVKVSRSCGLGCDSRFGSNLESCGYGLLDTLMICGIDAPFICSVLFVVVFADLVLHRAPGRFFVHCATPSLYLHSSSPIGSFKD